MALHWITGSLVSKQIWSEGLFTLSIHCPGVEFFEPGQFLQIGMPLPEKHLHRPYSVASPHSDTLEFFIVRVENGELTPRLWDLQIGACIDVSMKATGSFTLSHAPKSSTLWLIGSGTGLAPYIAMLRTQKIWDEYKRIVLVHGVRNKSDLAYTDELRKYEQDSQGAFTFHPITSREQVPGALSGRITKNLLDGSIEKEAKETIDPQHSAIMLCGNPDMLNDMEHILVERGLSRQKPKHPGQIIVERYW